MRISDWIQTCALPISECWYESQTPAAPESSCALADTPLRIVPSMRLCTHRSRGVFMRISSLSPLLAAAACALFAPASAGAQPADAAPTQGPAYLNRQQIGGASCRERVGTYVEF